MADYSFRISRASRVKEAHERIVAALDSQEHRVFSTQELVKLFREHRDEWWTLSNITSKNFIEYLERALKLRRIALEGPTHNQKFLRFLWREPSAIEVAGAMRANAYLCHSSAIFVHGLTDQASPSALREL